MRYSLPTSQIVITPDAERAVGCIHRTSNLFFESHQNKRRSKFSLDTSTDPLVSMAHRESMRQQIVMKDLIKGLKIRGVTSMLESGAMDPNTWIRLDEDANDEEATPLIILARIPATAAEKKDAISCFDTRKKISDPLNDDSNKTGKVRIQMVKAFLKHGADVNMRDVRGRTALIWASINGLNEMVATLLHQVCLKYYFYPS